ncbi:hypothetical protein Btru_050407 [Bulinus truncatus]|nr:hypothetical protein Btru_050407 [Bulinus truncatus]
MKGTVLRIFKRKNPAHLKNCELYETPSTYEIFQGFSKLSLQKHLILPGSSTQPNKREIPTSQIKERNGQSKSEKSAAIQTKTKKPKHDSGDDEAKADEQSNKCTVKKNTCNKSAASTSGEEISKFVSLRSEWTANKKVVRSIFTKGSIKKHGSIKKLDSIKKQGSIKRNRRLRDHKEKTSLAKLKSSKSAKIVWGDTGPVEIDQFEGEMCVYPKNIGANATYSRNAYSPFEESGQFGQTNNFIAAFCEPNAMFVQLSAFGQKIMTNRMAGDSYPLEIILTKPTTKPSSAVGVDEATSDLMMGDMKIIRNKYTDNPFLLTSRSPCPRVAESLPKVHASDERRDILLSNSAIRTVDEKGRQEQEPLDETRQKEQHTQDTMFNIQQLQHTEETEGPVKPGEHQETQAKSIVDHSKHTERNSEKDNTGQTVTAKSLNRQSDAKNNKSRSQASEAAQENIAFQFSLSVTKPDASRGRSTPLQTNSITLKNTENRSVLQIDISNSDFKSRICEKKSHDCPVRDSSELSCRKVGTKNIFNQHDQNVLWKLKEVDTSVKRDSDGGSRNSKSLNSSSHDTSLNSDKNTTEPDKISRYELNENVDSPFVSSGTSTVTGSSPECRSDTEDSVWRGVPDYGGDVRKTSSHMYSRASEENEDCDINRITPEMLERKPPAGNMKTTQERHLSAKSETGFNDTLGDTFVRVSSEQHLKDTASFSDSRMTERTSSNQSEMRTYETLSDECLGTADPSFATSPSSSTVTRSMKERSYQSIFGGKLPRRIITKDSILKVKYTEKDRQRLNQKRNALPKVGIEIKKAESRKPSVDMYRPKTLGKTAGRGSRELESPGTTTEDVINCLMNSADRLNQIYTSSSIRKQAFEGAIRNKINNPKYRPYTIPTSQEPRDRQRSTFYKKSNRSIQEKSQLTHEKTSREPMKSTNPPRTERSTVDQKGRCISSRPSHGNKDKASPKVDFKFQPKRLAPISPFAPKKVLRPDSSRLLYQRPMMSKNNVPATRPRNDQTKHTEYRLMKKSLTNEQDKHVNMPVKSGPSSQHFGQLRQKLPGAAPIRILHSRNKSEILSESVPVKAAAAKSRPVVQWVIGNPETTKNICMIESLHTESLDSNLDERNHGRLEEASVVSTPLPTQAEHPRPCKVDENNKQCDRVPTPDKSDLELRHVNHDSIATKIEKSLNDITFKSTVLTPVKNNRLPTGSNGLAEPPLGDRLQDLQPSHERKINFINQLQEKRTNVPGFSHRKRRAVSPKLQPRQDSQRRVTLKTKTNENVGLNAIWSPNVNVSPMISPVGLKQSSSTLSRFMEKCILPSLEEISEQRLAISPSPPSVLPGEKNVTSSSPNQLPTESKTTEGRKPNTKRPSRIPRYLPLIKTTQKNNALQQDFISSKVHSDFRQVNESISGAGDKTSLKGNTFLRSPVNHSKLRDSKNRTHSLRSAKQVGKNVALKNHDTGLKSVLPMLMNRVQDSIIIITPEKKVKHLNLIMNKGSNVNDSIVSDSKSNVVDNKSPSIGNNNLESLEYHREADKESFPDQCNLTIDGAKTRGTNGTVSREAHGHQGIRKEELRDIGMKKDAGLMGNEEVELQALDETSVWANNRLRNICCPKSCRLCGTHTSNDVTCDMGRLDMTTSHQQYTMKVEEQLFTHQKLHASPKAKDELNDIGELAAHGPPCHVTPLIGHPDNLHLVTNSLNNDGRNLIGRVCKVDPPIMKPKRSVISFGVKPPKQQQAAQRRSGLPRLNKTVTDPGKKETNNKEEGSTTSKPATGDKNIILSPVKILTCEDYRVREFDSPPAEPPTMMEIPHNARAINKPSSNQSAMKPKAAGDDINPNLPRSDVTIRRKISKIRVNKWEKATPTDVNEHSNGGKPSHTSANKRKPLSRGQVVKKKFTIRLDTAKPTASYPVCGSIETQSLNDEACTYKSNENGPASKKSKINITPKINATDHIPYHEAKRRSSNSALNWQSPLVGASNSKDSVTGQKRYSIKLPAKKWRTEMPQKIARQKVNLKILDQLLQQTKPKPAPPHREGSLSTHAGSIDKKTDNLLKGKALEDPPLIQVKQTRTSLQRKKSTHQHHDLTSGDQQVSSKSSKKIDISSEGKIRRQGNSVAGSGKDINPDHALKKSQKIHKKSAQQRPMYFSDHSPVKVLNQKERSEKNANTSSQSTDNTIGHLKKSTTNPASGNEIIDEKINEIIQDKDQYLDKNKTIDNAADSSYEHALSREHDASTTMPTTEAEMRVNTHKDKKKRDYGKHERASSSHIQGRGGEDDAVGRNDILCSEKIQTLLRNFRTEEQEMLVARLKNWIKNRLTQTENESETSTEAIVCKEIEYVLKNIINSLDTGTVKSIFHNIQPKLEHLDRILEVDEKSAELADSNKSLHRQHEDKQGERLKSRENESLIKISSEHVTEQDKSINSPSQCLSKFNMKNIKESTTHVDDSRQKHPFSFSKLPARDSRLNLLNRKCHADTSDNLFHTLMKNKQPNVHHNLLNRPNPTGANDRNEKEVENVSAVWKEMPESNATFDGKDMRFFRENNESHNQRLPSTLSPSPFADLTNMHSHDPYSYQQASDLSSDLRKRMYSGDSVFLYKRFPSASSASCCDVGATYVATRKSPLPIKKASYVISKKIGHFDESLRSLPEDLLLGSSTYSGPWSPISKGRLSDYFQGFDLGHSLSYESRIGSTRSEHESRPNNVDNVRDEKDSNSSAEVILSWLARTPDIEVSADRADKRDSSGYIAKAGATHMSQKIPLPTSSVEDDEIITDEKSSPWLAYLKHKSFSPLNLNDLDSSLDYPVSQRCPTQTRVNESGTKADIITWPVVKHLKLSPQHENLSENRSLLARKDKRKFEMTIACGDKIMQRIGERDHTRTALDQSEVSPTKSGDDTCRKEQNESFNNRLGRNMISYSQRMKHKYNKSSSAKSSSRTHMIDFSELESGNHSDFGAISNMQFNGGIAEGGESCSYGNSFDTTNLYLDSLESTSEWQLNAYNRTSQRNSKRNDEFSEVFETTGLELKTNAMFGDFAVTLPPYECANGDKDGEPSRCKISSNRHSSPALTLNGDDTRRSAESDSHSLANEVMNEWGAPEVAAFSQVSFDWYKPNVNSSRLHGDTTRDIEEENGGNSDAHFNFDNRLEGVKEAEEVYEGNATTIDTDPCQAMGGTSEYVSPGLVAINETQTSQLKSKRKLDSLETNMYECDSNEHWDKISGNQSFDRERHENSHFRCPLLQSRLILNTEKDECHYDRLQADVAHDDVMTDQGEGSNQKQINVSGLALTSENQSLAQQVRAPPVYCQTAEGHLRRSLCTDHVDSLAYPPLIASGRCVSFISARERKRNSCASPSNSRSQSEQFKAAHTSRSGYSYKLLSRADISYDNEMSYQKHLSTLGEKFISSLSVVNKPSCSSHPSSRAQARAPGHQCDDTIDSHNVTARPNFSHKNGFSYLYTDSFDSGGSGVDGTCSTRASIRPPVVRTRRPRQNTMVGQIVKMFEKRLQFRPIKLSEKGFSSKQNNPQKPICDCIESCDYCLTGQFERIETGSVSVTRYLESCRRQQLNKRIVLVPGPVVTMEKIIDGRLAAVAYFVILMTSAGAYNSTCDPEIEVCDCNITSFRVNTSHVGLENPRMLTEIIPFTVFADWAQNASFGLRVYAGDKLIETRLIELNNSRICGEEVQHIYHVQNYGPVDAQIQGYPQLDVWLYLLPNIEADADLKCENSSFCVKAQIIYHFAPLPKNLKFVAYPKFPKLGKYMNLSCTTNDGNPPVAAYSLHMYDYTTGAELFGALIPSMTFASAKAGKYRCSAINYPFGQRQVVFSRIISVKPEIKTTKLTTTPTSTTSTTSTTTTAPNAPSVAETTAGRKKVVTAAPTKAPTRETRLPKMKFEALNGSEPEPEAEHNGDSKDATEMQDTIEMMTTEGATPEAEAMSTEGKAEGGSEANAASRNDLQNTMTYITLIVIGIFSLKG